MGIEIHFTMFFGGNCIFVNLNIPSYSWWGTWTLKVRPWFKLGKVPLLQVVVVVVVLVVVVV